MSNKYGIPDQDLKEIRARDKTCVYCHKKMTNHSLRGLRSNWATIEHLNFLPPWNDPTIVAICYWSCNSSRGKKKLLDWFKTPYCVEKNITEETIAEPVKKFVQSLKGTGRIQPVQLFG